MKDFPSCFGENGVQVADSSSSSAAKAAQNLVSCVYHCKLHDRSCLITVTWTKNMMGQGLTVAIDDSTNQISCKFDIKPWLFPRKKGSKTLDLDSGKINLCWDLSNARFGSGSGPEPVEGFYLAVASDHEMVLLLGDLKKEAHMKINTISPLPDHDSGSAIFVAKREHIFGNKHYAAKAQFSGQGRMHDVTIECSASAAMDGPCLVIRIDCKTVLQIRRLSWKFRGNHTIMVDGVPVEVFWDVHNWVFGNNNGIGNAVFMFRTCLSAQKWLSMATHSVFDPSLLASQKLKDDQLRQGFGFSLMLYAWKNE